jgi:hypothetical protein
MAWTWFPNLPDLFFGFLLPQKKLCVQIYTLADDTHSAPLEADIQPSIDFAVATFDKRFNVKLVPYGRTWIETIDVGVPLAAFDVNCGFTGYTEEWGEAGEFFAQHLAGWNAMPVSATFPVTVFIVGTIKNKAGCSYGPLTDYVTVEIDGLKGNHSTMAHEIGHACNLLWHSFGKSNLMYADADRGDTVHWWQKNLVRSSRHVLWW